MCQLRVQQQGELSEFIFITNKTSNKLLETPKWKNAIHICHKITNFSNAIQIECNRNHAEWDQEGFCAHVKLLPYPTGCNDERKFIDPAGIPNDPNNSPVLLNRMPSKLKIPNAEKTIFINNQHIHYQLNISAFHKNISRRARFESWNGLMMLLNSSCLPMSCFSLTVTNVLSPFPVLSNDLCLLHGNGFFMWWS